MGWLSGFESMKEIRDRILSDQNERYKIIADTSTCYGRHYWVVYEYADGQRQLVLNLVRGANHTYAYKTMDESMGPAVADCPLRFLELVPEKDIGYTKEWRTKVRNYYANRKRRSFNA